MTKRPTNRPTRKTTKKGTDIVGYIVSDHAGWPMWMETRLRAPVSTRGVLWNGPTVTVFPSREKAQAAIDRTLEYSREKGYDKSWGTNYIIKGLVRHD